MLSGHIHQRFWRALSGSGGQQRLAPSRSDTTYRRRLVADFRSSAVAGVDYFCLVLAEAAGSLYVAPLARLVVHIRPFVSRVG